MENMRFDEDGGDPQWTGDTPDPSRPPSPVPNPVDRRKRNVEDHMAEDIRGELDPSDDMTSPGPSYGESPASIVKERRSAMLRASTARATGAASRGAPRPRKRAAGMSEAQWKRVKRKLAEGPAASKEAVRGQWRGRASDAEASGAFNVEDTPHSKRSFVGKAERELPEGVEAGPADERAETAPDGAHPMLQVLLDKGFRLVRASEDPRWANPLDAADASADTDGQGPEDPIGGEVPDLVRSHWAARGCRGTGPT